MLLNPLRVVARLTAGGKQDTDVPSFFSCPDEQAEDQYAGHYHQLLPNDRTLHQGTTTTFIATIPLVSTKACQRRVAWQYEYYLKDHQGDTRVRFSELNGELRRHQGCGELEHVAKGKVLNKN